MSAGVFWGAGKGMLSSYMTNLCSGELGLLLGDVRDHRDILQVLSFMKF